MHSKRGSAASTDVAVDVESSHGARGKGGGKRTAQVIIAALGVIAVLSIVGFVMMQVLPHHHSDGHASYLPTQVAKLSIERDAHEHAAEPEVRQQQQQQQQQQQPDQVKPSEPSLQPSPAVPQQQLALSAPTDDSVAVAAFLSAIRAKLTEPVPNWFTDLSKAMTHPPAYPSKEQRLATKQKFPSRRLDPLLISQPTSCPQKKDRDYEKEPILMIMPTGTGGIESMPCAVKCTYTSDSSMWSKADAWVDSIPYSHPAPGKVCPLQKRVMFSMEAESYYGALKMEADGKPTSGAIDVMGNTQLTSDVPLIYGNTVEYNYNEKVQGKTQAALAVMLISNCGGFNNRLQVAKGLMDNGVTVDSFGSCLNNKAKPAQGSGWFNSKVDIIRSYKFLLTFENSNVRDYVTEKFNHALVAGTVPVYLGADTIRDFQPSAHSVINVQDFRDTATLAEYLKWLGQNDDIYNMYLDWKEKGVSDNFKWMMSISAVHSNCR